MVFLKRKAKSEKRKRQALIFAFQVLFLQIKMPCFVDQDAVFRRSKRLC